MVAVLVATIRPPLKSKYIVFSMESCKFMQVERSTVMQTLTQSCFSHRNGSVAFGESVLLKHRCPDIIHVPASEGKLFVSKPQMGR